MRCRAIVLLFVLAALLVAAWPARGAVTVLLNAVTTSQTSGAIHSTTAGTAGGIDSWILTATLTGGARAVLYESLNGGTSWAPVGLFLYAPSHVITVPECGACRLRVKAICPAGASVTVSVTSNGNLTPEVVGP